jgi:hypothetical protein
MSVKIKIVPNDDSVAEDAGKSGGIKIKVVQDDATQIEMVARRALNGDIMVFEHDLIDIIVSPSKNKVVTFPKEKLQRETYSVQDRFFTFLAKKGVVDRADIQGGNIFSSIESEIYESTVEGVDSIQTALFATSLFIESEMPDIMARKHLQHDLMTYHLDPPEEESTELGEVPQKDKKGSLDSRVRPYGYQYMYSILRESEED